MPVIIVGMHRSGTSMLTRMLNLAGLQLGRNEHLMQPAFDNPEGFWENLEFVHINELLLHAFGGTWSAPPDWPKGWVGDSRLTEIRQAAAALPAKLQLHEPWGWKDPRTTVTLPFWLSLWPEARIVVCVRNPLEVACSLAQRNRWTLWTGLRLWLRYYRALLASVPLGQCVVCHYEALLDDPIRYLRSVLKSLDLPADNATIEQVLRGKNPELRHNGLDRGSLEATGLPQEWTDLYDRLSDAGNFPRPRSARPQEALQVVALKQALEMEQRADANQARFHDLAQRHAELQQLFQQLVDFAKDRTYWLNALQQRLSARRYRYSDELIYWVKRLARPWRAWPRQIHHAPPPGSGVLSKADAVMCSWNQPQGHGKCVKTVEISA
jgi:hypothetical protein